MKETIKKLITESIEKLYPAHRDLDFSVDYPPSGIDADFASNVAMVLAKKVGQKPMAVAEEIALALAPSPALDFARAPSPARGEGYKVDAVAPGFLNFKVSPDLLIKNLNEINKKPETYGSSNIGQGKLAVVEYFQLNVAKPPHVGHLRSAVIGDSLKRVLKFLGYKTVSDTHIGDWGTQFGLLLLGYKTLDGKRRIKDHPLEELNQLYIEINHMAEKDPGLYEQGKQEFVKLEQGDKGNRKLWQRFVKVSLKKFAEMVEILKLEPFDYDLGESFYEDKMPQILQRLEKAGLLVTGKTGEKYVDLDKYGLGRLLCVKSDGGTTYELRDLATLAYRYDELPKKLINELTTEREGSQPIHRLRLATEREGSQPIHRLRLAWNLYVVDTRQSHDFKQVFKTMELLGYDVLKSKHIEFGFMSLAEGAFSTRKGNVISLEALVDEAKRRAVEVIKEKHPDLRNKDQVAEQVALGAVKYGDLKHNRRSDIVFDWKDALSFEGNTGPYLQYTYARLKSILRKGKISKVHSVKISSAKEQAILRKLVIFPDKISDAATDFLPSILADYLYELAGVTNSFYHSTPVLQEKNEDLRKTRLAIVTASAIVLKTGLNLLGIEAPEEM